MKTIIKNIDIETSRLIKKSPKFCAFSRMYNPINICMDLRELGLSQFEAEMRMKDYHKHFYNPLIKRFDEDGE